MRVEWAENENEPKRRQNKNKLSFAGKKIRPTENSFIDFLCVFCVVSRIVSMRNKIKTILQLISAWTKELFLSAFV